MKPASRLTYDESLEKMQQIQDAIEDAKSRRDYERAKNLQNYLKKHEEIHLKLFVKHKDNLTQRMMDQLESEKLEKESQIVQNVISRLNEIYSIYDKNYADLEARHLITLEKLKQRFEQPRYTSIKFSSTVRQLQNAEMYYAGKHDFQAAAQIKKQLEDRIKLEADGFKKNTCDTIEAKIRDAVNHYQMQQKTFSQRLNTEKNTLKRDVKRMILGIENHYRKIIHNITGKNEIDITKSFESQILQTIDYEFGEYAKRLQMQYASKSPRNTSLSKTRTNSKQDRQRYDYNSRINNNGNSRCNRDISRVSSNESNRFSNKNDTRIAKYNNNSASRSKNYDIRTNTSSSTRVITYSSQRVRVESHQKTENNSNTQKKVKKIDDFYIIDSDINHEGIEIQDDINESDDIFDYKKIPVEPTTMPSNSHGRRKISFKLASENEARTKKRNPRIDFALKKHNKPIDISENLNNY